MSLWRRALIGDRASALRKAGALVLSRTNLSAWATLHTKQKLKVDLSSSVGRSIWFRGTYEPEVESLMRRVLRSGDAFIDVGSNVGYFSVVSTEIVGSQGEVHAFEPSRKICGYLKESIAANSLKNVFANAIALWSQPETLSFAAQRNSGFSHLVPEDPGRKGMGPDLVPAITLDRYVESYLKRPVKLVKIDVEGAEYHVLVGMAATLELHSPVLVVEVVDWLLSRFGNRVEDMFALLSSHGYQAYDLQGQQVSGAAAAQERLLKASVRNLVFAKASTLSVAWG
jgi:FkbM family methyltransferase